MCIVIRKAEVKDCPGIFDLITELAIHEKHQDQMKISLEKFREDGFGDDTKFQCFVAECEENGKCIHMEDIYVVPEYRSKGIGSKLIGSVCKVADLQNCGRVQFIVRDSNKSAMKFYKHQGAIDLTEVQEWHLFRLTSDAIEKVAAKYD
ncbi:thialysine N-epsilon-acetyltransferase-like isoform X2 [Crassostrea angulata]|uniref:thialysine N-epsilon-acetyltransferase-like isoform X2 n=1 Tax=Magallana angulata TaxID=2784310 RepID=UPI0022B0EE01|nr:thialysine N-epsilon-acetyltransferase-like isoform X2 [Crassostrea angulata]